MGPNTTSFDSSIFISWKSLEAPEKKKRRKAPEHFKELVERTRELCLTPAHTNQAGG